jgi:hypothetical protein
MSDTGSERVRRPARSLLGGRARDTSAPTGPTSLCRPALNMSQQGRPIIHYLLISVVVFGCNQGVPGGTLSTMYNEHPVVVASASMIFLVTAAPPPAWQCRQVAEQPRREAGAHRPLGCKGHDGRQHAHEGHVQCQAHQQIRHVQLKLVPEVLPPLLDLRHRGTPRVYGHLQAAAAMPHGHLHLLLGFLKGGAGSQGQPAFQYPVF